MKIGSLFSGYGGLDMGVQAAIGGEVAWHVEYDTAPSKILKHHWPNVANYGDVTTVDWSQLPPVDALTGGFPCQDLSLAGRRAGMRAGTRSGLWADYLKAITTIQPRLVVIENVRGLLSGCAESDLEPCPGCVGGGEHRPVLRALGRVLGDLAGVGYDARWIGLRAADAGAPHGRFRVFVVAYPDGFGRTFFGRVRSEERDVDGRGGQDIAWHAEEREALVADPCGRQSERWGGPAELVSQAGPHPRTGEERKRVRDSAFDSSTPARWGAYQSAVDRWERTVGRVAPAPTRPDGRNDGHRLSAGFVEWMMGLPNGHVTDPAIGLTRNEQLKALGNGVVPQQAEMALRLLGVAG